MPRTKNALSTDKAIVAEKEAEALKLRIAGLTMAQIAERLGYADPSGAYRAVKAGIRRACLLPAEELRSVQIARYEKLIATLVPLCFPPEDQPEDVPFMPSAKALDRLLKVFSQLENIAGLNITKVAPTNPGGDQPYQPFTPSNEYAANIFTILASAGIIAPVAEEGSNTTAE